MDHGSTADCQRGHVREVRLNWFAVHVLSSSSDAQHQQPCPLRRAGIDFTCEAAAGYQPSAAITACKSSSEARQAILFPPCALSIASCKPLWANVTLVHELASTSRPPFQFPAHRPAQRQADLVRGATSRVAPPSERWDEPTATVRELIARTPQAQEQGDDGRIRRLDRSQLSPRSASWCCSMS